MFYKFLAVDIKRSCNGFSCKFFTFIIFLPTKILQTEAVSTLFRFRQLRAVAGAPRPRPPRDPCEPSKPRALPARTPFCGGGGRGDAVLFETFDWRCVWSLEGFGGGSEGCGGWVFRVIGFLIFLSDGHTNLCRLLGTWTQDMSW